MSLIDRLSNDEDPKIPVHQFYAALAEYAAGAITRAGLVSYFQMSAEDETELDALIADYQAAPADRKQEFLEFVHRIFILAEVKAPGYDTKAALNTRINNF